MRHGPVLGIIARMSDRCAEEILLVDDERAVREGIKALLESSGYVVRAVRDGASALAAFRERPPALVLLDVMMPGMDGFSVCRAIREADASTPVLFLTALDSDADQIRGLGLGADDYVSKTVPAPVLLARVACAVRRARIAEPSGDFTFGAWRVAASHCEMRCGDGEPTSLADREIALLRLFVAHPGEVLARDWLVDKLWGAGRDVTDDLLSVTLYNLRRKLAADGDSIEHVRGVGYVWRPGARRERKKS